MINTKGILARTYFDTFSVYRKSITAVAGVKRQSYSTISTNKKCKLSRGSGNRNIVRSGAVSTLEYQSVLFCDPSLIIEPGDRIVVKLSDGIREYSFDAGEPIVYHSHQEIPLNRSAFIMIPGNMTCLIYNKTITLGVVKYKPYLLNNVFYERKVANNPSGQINEPSNVLSVGISYSDDYKIPSEYQDSPAGSFTLQKGDAIVLNSDYASTEYNSTVEINKAFDMGTVFIITDIIEHIIPFENKINIFEVIAKWVIQR